MSMRFLASNQRCLVAESLSRCPTLHDVKKVYSSLLRLLEPFAFRDGQPIPSMPAPKQIDALIVTPTSLTVLSRLKAWISPFCALCMAVRPDIGLAQTQAGVQFHPFPACQASPWRILHPMSKRYCQPPLKLSL